MIIRFIHFIYMYVTIFLIIFELFDSRHRDNCFSVWLDSICYELNMNLTTIIFFFGLIP